MPRGAAPDAMSAPRDRHRAGASHRGVRRLSRWGERSTTRRRYGRPRWCRARLLGGPLRPHDGEDALDRSPLAGGLRRRGRTSQRSEHGEVVGSVGAADDGHPEVRRELQPCDPGARARDVAHVARKRCVGPPRYGGGGRVTPEPSESFASTVGWSIAVHARPVRSRVCRRTGPAIVMVVGRAPLPPPTPHVGEATQPCGAPPNRSRSPVPATPPARRRPRDARRAGGSGRVGTTPVCVARLSEGR